MIRSEEGPRLTAPTIEEMAREDAALDRRLAEPLWYPVFERWALAGTIGGDEWRHYRAAYVAAASGARRDAGQVQ